ncbi:nucleoside deaminase [Pseudonocardiaceae bacterium YIM PH 21723]|nr:nucleoside deaminase [Pseudonocardiaceae bacterium YIM PH 21723]
MPVAEADTRAMREAIRVARSAMATRDVPIGAVVLGPDGRVLSYARNAREYLGDPTAHAEIRALRSAAREFGDGWRLGGCTLAVTVEPCAMCAGAVLLSRVSRLVFGCFEPKTGAVGSVWDIVRDRRLGQQPEVVSGVLAEECAALLQEFFAEHRGEDPL